MTMRGPGRGCVLAFVVILSATRLVSFMVVTRLKYLFLAPLLLVMSGCGYNRFDALPEPDETAPHANITLASVRSYYERGEVDMPEGVVVGGRVTTSDSAGNFYKMIVIQQGDVSLAVLTGTYDTYSAYRPGERVVVRLDGLRLGLWDGMLAVGVPEPNYPKGIDYISSDVVLRQMMFRSEEPMPEIDTLEVTIPEVTEALAGRLVRVVDGSFTQGGRHTWSGEQTYSIGYGRSVKVYTSPYATFADYVLPEGKVDLVGVVTTYRESVQIKVSSTDDVHPVEP